MRRTPEVSKHAYFRWRQRCWPQGTAAEAHNALDEFLRGAKASPRARGWTRTHGSPSVTFAYHALMPGVAGVIEDGVLVTVIGRPRTGPQTLPNGARPSTEASRGRDTAHVAESSVEHRR